MSLQFDFQLQILVLALKMEILVQELDTISMRECRNIIVVQIEVRGDTSVGDYGFGLTILAVVVLEMQGESSPSGIFGGDLNGGNGIEYEGMVELCCNFNRCWRWVPQWWGCGWLDEKTGGGC